MNNDQFNIGIFGAGGKLLIDTDFLSFSHPYGRTFRVRITDIETVTVDSVGLGKGELKIIGKGTELAKVKMPIPWANKCQEWIFAKIS
jgi:hypothetical protein